MARIIAFDTKRCSDTKFISERSIANWIDEYFLKKQAGQEQYVL